MSKDIIEIDFSSAQVVADPFPWYERVRSMGRCVPCHLSRTWLVTGYEDALAILRNPGQFSSAALAQEEFGPWYHGASTMLGVDPPDHNRLRSAVQRLFTSRATAQREARVREIVADLLRAGDVASRLVSGSAVEMVAALAAPLPVLVTSDLLNLPSTDAGMITQWTDRMVLGTISALMSESTSSEATTYRDALTAGDELSDYMEHHLIYAQRSSATGESDRGEFLQAILAAVDSHEMTWPEAVAVCVLVVLAATETTTKLIGNALALLGTQHRQRELILRRREILSSAVEEVLRFSGPAQFAARLVTGETTVGETTLHQGDTVWVLIPAAGRDPAVFRNPGQFDVTRTPNPHLSFGHSVHLCLGAPLARLEARTAVEQTLDLAPNYQVDRVEYGNGFFVRGPMQLEISP